MCFFIEQVVVVDEYFYVGDVFVVYWKFVVDLQVDQVECIQWYFFVDVVVEVFLCVVVCVGELCFLVLVLLLQVGIVVVGWYVWQVFVIVVGV